MGAAVLRSGKCLVAQRGPSMSLAGKWEFPGGKVEPEELPERALAREIAEELGLQIEVHELLGSGTARAAELEIVLDVYAASIVGGELTLREHATVTWATAEQLSGFDWADADIPSVAAVAARLAR